MKDKRKHERFNALARVMIRKANFRATYYTRNVSAGGMYISTDDDLMGLKNFKLTICLSKADPLTVDARAVHHRPPCSNPGSRGYGIEFIGVSEDMRTRIKKAIAQILREQYEKNQRSEQRSPASSLSSCK